MNYKFMINAVKEAKENSKTNYINGGPFGAVIIKNGEIISSAHNTVISSQDPTAHAEVNAIRLAAKKLGTHDLSECEIYASSEPCPMCLSAIIWSNIKVAYFANSKEDASKIGFRDDDIYDFIKDNKKDILELHHMDCEEAKEIFKDFEKNQKKIIY